MRALRYDIGDVRVIDGADEVCTTGGGENVVSHQTLVVLAVARRAYGARGLSIWSYDFGLNAATRGEEV